LKEALIMADTNPQALKSSGDKVAAASQAQTNTVKADKAADSMLDIFTTEDLADTLVGKLSKDLGDISILALLEQTKQLAEQMRLGPY
jgi:hypothetical protein